MTSDASDEYRPSCHVHVCLSKGIHLRSSGHERVKVRCWLRKMSPFAYTKSDSPKPSIAEMSEDDTSFSQ